MRATLRLGAGSTVQREYEYVVGCDGKRSLVREHLGIVFRGNDYPVHFVLGDYTVDLPFARDEAHYFVYDSTFFLAVPLATNEWRLVLKREGAYDPEVPPDPLEIPRRVDELLRRRSAFSSPSWLSKAPLTSEPPRRSAVVGSSSAAMRLISSARWRHRHEHRHAGCAESRMEARFRLGSPRLGKDPLAHLRSRAIAGDRANGARHRPITRLICGLSREPSDIEPWLPIMKNRTLMKGAFPLRYSGLAVRYPPSVLTHGAMATSVVGGPCPGLLRMLSRLDSRTPAGRSFHVLAGGSAARIRSWKGPLDRLARHCSAAYGTAVKVAAFATDQASSESEVQGRTACRRSG